MYPEYKRRQLIIAGESYAGKYIPTVAKKVQDYNTEQFKKPYNQQSYFNLTAALMGDPLTGPIPQRLSRNKIA
jgi:carboxypeptidase C (cathepsin A)